MIEHKVRCQHETLFSNSHCVVLVNVFNQILQGSVFLEQPESGCHWGPPQHQGPLPEPSQCSEKTNCKATECTDTGNNVVWTIRHNHVSDLVKVKVREETQKINETAVANLTLATAHLVAGWSKATVGQQKDPAAQATVP
jgi:hypothetical protein